MQVIHEPDASRFTLNDGDELVGLIDYRITGDTMHLTHTEIDPRRRHAGLGGRLVQGALDHLRDNTHYRVDPVCPFAAAWIDEHPEYAELTRR